MKKNVRGIGREPSHKERGFSEKMAPAKDPAFRTIGRRQGTGFEPGAGELPRAHHGPGEAALRKIRGAS
jgi:hypothetical protein